MRTSRSESRRFARAFTLIELLVVVSIIALLVAMLLPTLSAAKETGRRVLCAANLRQWGLTIHSYSADNGGWFPGATAWGANDIFSDFDLASGYPTPVNMEQTYTRWMESYGFALKITRCPSRVQARWSWSDNYPSAWFATDYFHFFGRGDRDQSDSYFYSELSS